MVLIYPGNGATRRQKSKIGQAAYSVRVLSLLHLTRHELTCQPSDSSRRVGRHTCFGQTALTFSRLPLSLRGAQTVLDARKQVEAVVKGDDDRLLVVVG